MTEIEYRNYGFPIDCILDTGDRIVLCSYEYNNGEREGKLHFINRNDMSIAFEVETSGTLHGFHRGNRIYTANSKDITVFEDQRILAKVVTSALNTYISGGTHIYVSNTLGEINLFSYDLEHIECIRISQEPVWIVKQFGDFLYFGDESGYCYRYDLIGRSHIQIGQRRQGIIDIFHYEDTILISSYDDNLEIYDFNTLKLREIKEKVGSLWRIEKADEKFVCACIYEGIKIFDKEFNLIGSHKTSSICYGLCVTPEHILWSSFYENSVGWATIDTLTS